MSELDPLKVIKIEEMYVFTTRNRTRSSFFFSFWNDIMTEISLPFISHIFLIVLLLESKRFKPKTGSQSVSYSVSLLSF